MKPIKFETLKKKLAAAGLNFDDVSYIDEHGTLINALMVNHDYKGCYPTREALTAHNTAANIAYKAGYQATSRGSYTGTLITYRDGEQPTPTAADPAPTSDEPAADPEPEQPATGYTVSRNEQFNSVEITFTSKPGDAVRDALKARGFRWHRARGLWYGYADADEITAAINAAMQGDATPAPKMAKAAGPAKSTLCAPVKPETQDHIKIYYNGIKIDGGKLIKCFYSLNNNRDNADSILIHARGYEDLPRDLLPVRNETDIYTDYFDNDHATLTPEHPLYKYFRYAAIKAEIKDFTRYIDNYNKELARPERWHGRHEQLKKDIEKYRAKLAELEKETDPGQPTAADLAEIDRRRTEAENKRREEEHKKELEERERVLQEQHDGKEYINRIAAEHPIKAGEPVVNIPYSENPAFYSFMIEDQKMITLHPDGTETETILQEMPRCVLSVTAADIVLNHFDKLEAAKNCGYDKTDFIITWTDEDGEPGQYKGRYDLGDNDGGLIEHIRSLGEWYLIHDHFGHIKETPDETNDTIEFAAYLAQFKTA